MKFKLKCKSLSGEISIIEVNEADRIDKIKRNLSIIVKIKHENIGFLYRNRFLFNDKFVSDYQIGNEEIVVYFQYENCARYSISDSVDDRLRDLNINIDQDNNKLIEVFVKYSGSPSRIQRFQLPKRSFVAELRQMVADRMNIKEISFIEFTFRGETLSDEKTLEYYDIEDGDTIVSTYKVISGPPHFPNLSILPLNDGYDRLELLDVSNIDQIINKIHNRYNIDRINIRLYNNADKTGSIINIYDIQYIYNLYVYYGVYYLIEHEIDKYEICTKLGVGTFGVTFRCKENSSSEIYAMKQFKISKEGNNRKINIEKQLTNFVSLEKHPRIIELIKQFNDIDSSYILMEYIDRGSITSIMTGRNGVLVESDCAKYAQQILEGLEYLHIVRIIHGNIKGSNILIDKNGNVKLSDFGLRKIFHNISNRNLFNEELQSEIGDINWLSPEIIRGGQLVPASDIWSFGAVMVEMITGEIPHYGLSVGQIVFAIMKGQIQFECPRFYKDHVKSFINICLKIQPRERANFDDLYEHSFLK